jgi:hypothetical protein
MPQPLWQIVAMGGCLTLATACGGKAAPHAADKPSTMDTMMDGASTMDSDPASVFGPLEVGADWATYTKFNTSPVRSETHGGRLVDTYVNAVGAAAYLDDSAEIPAGTIVVKTSHEADGSDGPLFVMAKLAAGTDPDRGDWSYAIHWAEPPARWRAKLGGPIYWRTPSKKATYCVECHENYDRGLGGVPAAQRITELP